MTARGMIGDELERGLGKLRIWRTRAVVRAWREKVAKAEMGAIESLELAVHARDRREGDNPTRSEEDTPRGRHGTRSAQARDEGLDSLTHIY